MNRSGAILGNAFSTFPTVHYRHAKEVHPIYEAPVAVTSTAWHERVKLPCCNVSAEPDVKPLKCHMYGIRRTCTPMVARFCEAGCHRCDVSVHPLPYSNSACPLAFQRRDQFRSLTSTVRVGVRSVRSTRSLQRTRTYGASMGGASPSHAPLRSPRKAWRRTQRSSTPAARRPNAQALNERSRDTSTTASGSSSEKAL